MTKSRKTLEKGRCNTKVNATGQISKAKHLRTTTTFPRVPSQDRDQIENGKHLNIGRWKNISKYFHPQFHTNM